MPSCSRTHRLVGPSLDHVLVGDSRTDADNDPDGVSIDGCGDRERGLGVVPQDVAMGQSTASFTALSTRVIAATVCFETFSGETGLTVVFDHEAADDACDQSLGLRAASRTLASPFVACGAPSSGWRYTIPVIDASVPTTRVLSSLAVRLLTTYIRQLWSYYSIDTNTHSE